MKRFFLALLLLAAYIVIFAAHPGIADELPADPYAEIIETQREFVQSGAYKDEPEFFDIESEGQFGYALMDIDGDDSDELMFLTINGFIQDIYTVVDGSAELVESFDDGFYCAKVTTSGILYTATLESFLICEYRLEAGKLVFLDGVAVRADDEGAVSCFRADATGVETVISEEEAAAFYSEFEAEGYSMISFIPLIADEPDPVEPEEVEAEKPEVDEAQPEEPEAEVSVETTEDPTSRESANVLAPKVYETLRKGNRGDEVLALQERLIELGYLKEEADGSYGKKTEDAVKAFQADNGLKRDGVAGNKTLQAIFGE